jgi:uncharacterized protein YgbK (DUF1537 family)
MTVALPLRAKLLFYGDDFTGAADNAAQFARHGLRTQLFFHHPGMEALRHAAQLCDVVGVAGTARSLDTSAMNAELLPVLQDFAMLNIPLVQYKCCSTFDSSPQVGSLGHAIALMRETWPQCLVPVLAATPEFGRYTVFGHHFARAGSGIFRLDRHPVMSAHPVTPMHESDLRLVLQMQGFDCDGSVDLRLLDQHADDPLAIAKHLADTDSAVFDGLTQRHMVTAAASLCALSKSRAVCAMASQGLAHGLGQWWRESTKMHHALPAQQLAACDKLLVLSGSCSVLSASQIEHAKRAGFLCMRMESPARLAQDDDMFDSLQSRMMQALMAGQSVVIYTSLGPEDVASEAWRSMTADWPSGELSRRIGHYFSILAGRAFRQGGLTRLVVAGGDSSSYTMRALGAQALQPQASHFAQNAHFARLVCSDATIDGKEVLLKGGQVGAENLYNLALEGFVSG